jgi:hypothetical protein
MKSLAVPFAAVALALGLAGCLDADAAVDDSTVELAAANFNCSSPHSEGKSCNDGLFCTVEDRCAGGVCIGEERPCNDVVGFCSVGTCDEVHDTCVAEPREDDCTDLCDTNKLKKFYRKGWKQGFQVVSKIWDRRAENCASIDDFVDQVFTRLETAHRFNDNEANEKAHRRCRKAGVLDGAYAALDDIQNLCDQVCFLDGDLVGRLSAATYCEMAIGADGPLDVASWIRGPIGTCGFSYEVACDGSFIGASLDYVNDAGACAPMTEGAYATPWDNTRDRSCDFPD